MGARPAPAAACLTKRHPQAAQGPKPLTTKRTKVTKDYHNYRFAHPATEHDFLPRQRLDNATLIELFRWSEDQFMRRLEGSPIRRIGHDCWLRNIAVALGNAPTDGAVIAALTEKLQHPSELVREHVLWALDQHQRAPA